MKFARVFLVFALSSLFFATSASAAQQFGRTFAPAISTLPTAQNFVLSASDGSHRAPSSGVITRFSHEAEEFPEPWVKLMIIRQSAAGFQVVGLSEPQTMVGLTLGTWQTRISVQAGDLIGLAGPTPSLAAASQTLDPADVFFGIELPALSVGQNFPDTTAEDSYIGYAFDVSAVIEPDADNDGYGDETQDQCATDATTQGPCDTTAPSLTLKSKKFKRGATSISFTVKSNEAATFKLTGNFKASKKKYKIKAITKTLTAGKTVTIKVKVPSRAKSKLKAGTTLKGSLAVKATDTRGNVSTYTSKPRILAKK
jgi:hypothetical protein